MLVSFSRTGPLRHRILKGFVVAADDPATVIAAVVARRPDLSPLRLYTNDRMPGAIWLDTGMLWLTDPVARTRLRQTLASGAATLAATVRAAGGRLVPGGWLGARGRADWLCPDLHAVETITDVQREICANLLRAWAPELIALTGQASFGGDRVHGAGSRRLADSGEHLSTRYLASASPRHLGRVRDSLRRDEGVSRLELMDVNPAGLADTVPNVAVRCIDAQLLPTTVLAHALLVQALAVEARKLERDGRRVPAVPQAVLDRNRSRAISAGLAATFDPLQDRSDKARRGRSDRARPDGPVPARERALALLEQVVPQLRAMRVMPDELAPVAFGLTLAGTHASAVRKESDLLRRWAQDGADLDRAEFFGDATWLERDHVTATNTQAYPGATALARSYWANRLRPAPRRASAPPSPRRPSTDELFAKVGDERLSAREVTAALADYARGGGTADLLPALRKLPGDQAKAIRRTLRPGRASTRQSAAVPPDWEGDQAAEAKRLAGKDGRALLTVKLPAAQRDAAVAAARHHVRRPPDGLAVLLLTNAAYRDPAGGQCATIELLLVDTTVEAAR
ncbi:hypothetical protein AB0J80_12075 [Actinoplanes sp. NPDC049548]|uniref:hypothetical protein n=1 Tax=Actinoplanes sp. NPDC049548 TaxID=3155152 RepID=UPI00344721CF